MTNDDAKPIVVVHQCYSDGEAEVVAGVLRSENIEAFVKSDPPHSVLPVTAGRFGRVLVYVAEEEEERAREVLANHLKENEGND